MSAPSIPFAIVPPTFGACMGYAQWYMHDTAYYHPMVLCYFDWKNPLKISACAPGLVAVYMCTSYK